MYPYLILLKREIVVLLPWVLLLLSSKLFECPDDTETCVARLDHVIYVTVACRAVRIAEEVVVLLLLFLCHTRLLLRVLDCLYIL